MRASSFPVTRVRRCIGYTHPIGACRHLQIQRLISMLRAVVAARQATDVRPASEAQPLDDWGGISLSECHHILFYRWGKPYCFGCESVSLVDLIGTVAKCNNYNFIALMLLCERWNARKLWHCSPQKKPIGYYYDSIVMWWWWWWWCNVDVMMFGAEMTVAVIL